jgi:DNA-binding IclR family transcriptional regulator
MINSITNTRALLVLEARRSDQTLKQIAEKYGFSKQAAHQLVRGLEIEQQLTSGNPWFELSPRCRLA